MYQWCSFCHQQDAWFGSYYTSGKCDKCFLKKKEEEKQRTPFELSAKYLNSTFLVSIKYNETNKQWSTLSYEPATLSYESIQSLCAIPQLERC